LLDHIVRALGVSWDRVVKITTFLRHPEHFGRLAEVQDGVFRNLGRMLEAAGASWSDVVKLNAYLKDRRGHAALVRIRGDHVPATSVVVTDLISGAVDPRFLLQADCVAAVA
jgi:enamine deaminase RidA (YjgF/YER057c/UK114 family)